MAWYDTGTVAVTNGSTTVTGTGTNFLIGAQIGEGFYGPDGRLYEIASITSSTVLVLADPYVGTNQTGQEYKIVPTQSLVADLATQVSDLITDFSDVRDQAGSGKFNDGTVTAPGITFEQDQNNGLYRIGADNWAMSAAATKIVDVSASGIGITGNLTVDTDTLFVDASSNRVGIGDSDPVSALTVGGTAGLNWASFGDSSGLATIGTQGTSGGSLFVNTPSVTSFYASGLGIDGSYSSAVSTINIRALGVRDTGYKSQLTFSTTSSSTEIERMRIDVNGKVGIGTSNPQATLDVKCNLSAYSSAATFRDNGDATNWARIDIKNGNATSNNGLLLYQDNVGNVALRNDNADGTARAMSFVAGGTTAGYFDWQNTSSGPSAMRISATGNVGIGNSSPSYSMHIGDGTATEILAIQASNTGASHIFFGDAADVDAGRITYDHSIDAYLITNSGNQERMRIDATGNVGIGSLNPINSTNYKTITINGAATGGGQIIFQEDNNPDGFIYSTPSSFGVGAGVGNSLQFFINSSGQNNEAMRIDSSGNLLAGTTNTSITADAGLRYIDSASSPNLVVTGTATSGGYGFSQYSTAAANYRFYTDWAGQIFATATSITGISDASLKENVRDLDKGLDTVLALKPRRFDWKNGDGNDIMGFIAQEVEEVMPELVHEYQYNEDETKKALKMGDMIPSMVKAIQELSAQVDSLKAEVAALKGA